MLKPLEFFRDQSGAGFRHVILPQAESAQKIVHTAQKNVHGKGRSRANPLILHKAVYGINFA